MPREIDPSDLVRALMALGGLLRQAIAEALGPHGMTPEQQELLSLLATGLRSSRELSRASGRDKTTLSRAVARAAGSGLVTHERRSDDRRKQELRLTERGAALAEETERVVERRAPALVAALSPKEQRRLAKMVKKLRKGLAKARGRGEPGAAR
ncbi:MAG: MarR family transcriptional regulator [Polyangiaceae bacterium]|nr:MarR family transcriptional regulator [Polyangiaceae bacterium]